MKKQTIINKSVLFVFLLSMQGVLFAQERCDSLRIYFHQGRSDIDMQLFGNGSEVERFVRLCSVLNDSVRFISRIHVIGAASPEGGMEFNKELSEQRAAALIRYVSPYIKVPIVSKDSYFSGRDWSRLVEMVLRDRNVPAREEVLCLLGEILCHDKDGGEGRFQELKKLRGGKPYSYLYRYHFPKLRSSLVKVCYSREKEEQVQCTDTVYVHTRDTVYVRDTVFVTVPEKRKPFYLAVKNNMILDAVLVPNIGVDLYLGKNWSLSANWAYAWWKSDRKHNYWRTYGGDLEVRYWLGNNAAEKPLSGHHFGVYGQIATYDFELGGRGYLGDKWSCGGGVSYGYSLPVGKRLNIDFTLGFGYFGGVYKEYLPIGGHYVWQKTCRLNWFGPTKVEVALVWLIGRGNENRRKGGFQ